MGYVCRAKGLLSINNGYVLSYLGIFGDGFLIDLVLSHLAFHFSLHLQVFFLWPKQYGNCHEEWSHSTPEQAPGTVAVYWHCCSNWNMRRLFQNSMAWKGWLCYPTRPAPHGPMHHLTLATSLVFQKKDQSYEVFKHRTALLCPAQWDRDFVGELIAFMSREKLCTASTSFPATLTFVTPRLFQPIWL